MSRVDLEHWSAERFAIVDVEGNGQQPPEIVEIALVVITGGKAAEPWASLVRPAREITARVQRIHGISNEAVAHAPRFARLANDLIQRLGDAILVAHSAAVERDILSRQLSAWRPRGILDTRKLARAAFPSFSSHSLQSLARELDLKGPLQAHRAAADVLLTQQVFFRSIEVLNHNLTSAELRRIAGIDARPPGADQMELL